MHHERACDFLRADPKADSVSLNHVAGGMLDELLDDTLKIQRAPANLHSGQRTQVVGRTLRAEGSDYNNRPLIFRLLLGTGIHQLTSTHLSFRWHGCPHLCTASGIEGHGSRSEAWA